ncbi:MAG: hypothetical protein EBR01_12760 [Proteobacteria bacterium]|nr:hypothetical protein [Pseudomonadota bacterium]
MAGYCPGILEPNQVADLECGQCGNPLERAGEECPKCGNREAVRADGKRVLEVDVAHSGETVEWALAKLEQAVDETLKAGYAKLRVIHGYGSQAHHTHRIQGAVRAKLEGFQQRYGGRLETTQNLGATEWILLKSSKKLGRGK